MSTSTIIHLLVPDENGRDFQCKSYPPFSIGQHSWTPTKNVELDGVFYDYVRNASADILGIRYWLIDEVIFERHQVFKFFLNDSRFFFHQEDSCVDILFDEKNIADFKNNLLFIDCAQDFGGESVITNGKKYGIALEIDSRQFFSG